MLFAVIAIGVTPSMFLLKAAAQQTIDVTASGGGKAFGGEKMGTVTIEPRSHTVHITANITSPPKRPNIFRELLSIAMPERV